MDRTACTVSVPVQGCTLPIFTNFFSEGVEITSGLLPLSLIQVLSESSEYMYNICTIINGERDKRK